MREEAHARRWMCIPQVKGIQIMNDNGSNYMFKQYAGQWIPDYAGRRQAIVNTMRSWNATVQRQ